MNTDTKTIQQAITVTLHRPNEWLLDVDLDDAEDAYHAIVVTGYTNVPTLIAAYGPYSLCPECRGDGDGGDFTPGDGRSYGKEPCDLCDGYGVVGVETVVDSTLRAVEWAIANPPDTRNIIPF